MNGKMNTITLIRICSEHRTNHLNNEKPRGGGGATWVFFGWVRAARESKLAPRSKKNSPKIDTPF